MMLKLKSNKNKKVLILLMVLAFLPFFITIIYSFSLVAESYHRYGLIKGTILIPKALYCKWDAPSAKAEDICMGFLWGDDYWRKQSKQLEQIIKNAIVNGGYLEILPITNFEWDQLYIFTPYTTFEKINKQLGFNWLETKSQNSVNAWFGFKKTHIDYSDDRNLLVFTKDNYVVSHVDFLRNYGDFRVNKLNVFSPRNAVFEIKNNSGGTELTYKENTWLTTDCRYKEHILDIKTANQTTCVLTKISGYSSTKLVVLDKFNDSYKLRIFGEIGDLKNMPIKHKFTLEYEELITDVDSENGSVWIIDSAFEEIVLKKYIDHKIALIGFINKDNSGYSLRWKN